MKEPKKRTGLLHTSIGEHHKKKLVRLAKTAKLSVAEFIRRFIDSEQDKRDKE